MATACPQHFSISMDELYSKANHEEKYLSIDPITGAPMAQGQLQWLLNKGDLVLSDRVKPVLHQINFSFRASDHATPRMLHIYSYSDDEK